jgi:hypothetical protein
MDNFFDYYSICASSDSIEKTHTKSPNGKKCRFCQKSYPEVSFNNIPHIVPELFGRNKIVSNFECDGCNAEFQKCENDASTMVQHYLSLLKIKTKKGVPSFQSLKEPHQHATRLTTNDGISNINFGINHDDFLYDYTNKTLTIKFRTRRFRPFAVYKVFLRMAISLLTEDEFEANRHYLDFLKAVEPIENGTQIWTAYRYMLKTKLYNEPKITLFKAKETLIETKAYPEYSFLLQFANVSFYFFLPISQKNIKEYTPLNKLELQLFPSFIDEDIKQLKQIETHLLELNETRKVSITDTILFHYNSLLKDHSENDEDTPEEG